MPVLLERRVPIFTRRQPAEDLLAGPIRGELLGPDGLAERARVLARSQVIRPFEQGSRRTPLLSRLDVSRRVLADSHARLMAAAGYDPREMARFFERLYENGGEREESGDHPDPASRVAAIGRVVAELKPSPARPHDSEEFRRIKSRLSGR